MRSLLFVPGDRPAMMRKALGSGADALILDLEDSVAVAHKSEARREVLAFLRETRDAADRPRLFVRINPLEGPLAVGDLDCVMTAAPEGIVLPKCRGRSGAALLASRLSVREALHGWPDGGTRILPIATETPAAVFQLGSYAGASVRLCALTWGAEDLAAEIGALANRAGGTWTAPFRLVRSLCLFGAAAAGVPALDTVHLDIRDLEGLKRLCAEAARDGFTGKLAIHPNQIKPINEAFSPSTDALERAREIVAALSEEKGAGVTTLKGEMIDQPHLRAAERLLARAVKPRS
jgi:citrate lyase subunit beta/citryl-CoA lyase